MTESIVLTVCKELSIHPGEFFGRGKDKRLSNARMVAIQRLRAAGFSKAAVARLMKRSYSTIQYWLFPEYRKRRTEYFRALRIRRGKPPKTDRRWLTDEQKKHLLSVYLNEGYAAAVPICIAYKVKPRNISQYARAVGIKGKPGWPLRRETRAA